MTIIFYDVSARITYICAEGQKMALVKDSDSVNLIDLVPNDDILYVQKGHFLTKKQFSEWLSGNSDLEDYDPATDKYAGFMEDDNVSYTTSSIKDKDKAKKYVHPKSPGSVVIYDIKTNRFPNGVSLNGKWDFIDLDELGGEEAVNDSPTFRYLIKKGKIEIVPEDYYRQNKHKKKASTSLADAALQSILVPVGIKADAAAAAGGIENVSSHDAGDVIEINVE